MSLYLKRLLLQRDRRRMDVRPHHGFDKPTAAQMQRHQKGLVAPRSHDRFQWASSGWVKRLRKFRDTHGIVAERIKRLQIQRDRWMRERWWIKGCANAETGTLNEVYTLAVSQCMAVLWCRALVQVFGSWCCFLVLAGVWLWCRRRPWCRLALAHNPLHRLSKAMNGGHSAYSPCKSTSHKGTVWLARGIKPPSWGRRARAFQLLRVFWNLPPSQCVNIANWWQQAPQSFSCQDHQQMILISSDWSFWPLMVSNFCRWASELFVSARLCFIFAFQARGIWREAVRKLHGIVEKQKVGKHWSQLEPTFGAGNSQYH